MGFSPLAESQTDSKRKAFRLQEIARSPVRNWYDGTKCRGAGCVCKNLCRLREIYRIKFLWYRQGEMKVPLLSILWQNFHNDWILVKKS